MQPFKRLQIVEQDIGILLARKGKYSSPSTYIKLIKPHLDEREIWIKRKINEVEQRKKCEWATMGNNNHLAANSGPQSSTRLKMKKGRKQFRLPLFYFTLRSHLAAKITLVGQYGIWTMCFLLFTYNLNPHTVLCILLHNIVRFYSHI